MLNPMHSRLSPRLTLTLAVLCLSGLATALAAADPAPAPAAMNAFAKANMDSFRSFTLRNGIPVVVKLNPDNRIFNLRLVIRGGSALTTADNAGIEALMLATMARGSADWPYEKLTRVLDATSSGIASSVGFDSASFSLNTLDKYFERVFPIWADTITNPAFAQADFDQERTNALEALEGSEQDAWAKLGRETNKVFFGTHPYAHPFDGTMQSVGSLTRDAVKDWYASRFSARRLMVVAVGNYDIERLKADLDRTIGGLPDRPVDLPAPVAFGSAAAPRSNPGGLSVFDFPQSKGIAYLRGDFPAPGPADPDYAASQIAFKMLSDLLFEVVRTRHSAVYTPGARTRGFSSNYGSITIYKTSQANKVKAYIDEALAPLLAGRCLATAGGGPGGSHVGAEAASAAGAGAEGAPLALEPIAQALPVYAAQYVNEVYEQQQTNASVAAQIEASLLYTGDCRSYLLDIDRIKAVKAADIERVIRKTLVEGTVTWGLIGNVEAVAGVRPEDFKGFAGAVKAAGKAAE